MQAANGITQTNYCAQAIDDLKKHSSALPYGLTLDTVNEMLINLRSAVKFRLPDYGRIFDRSSDSIGGFIEKYCPAVRLPFPVVALEVPIPDCKSLPDYLGRTIMPDAAGLYDATIILAWESGGAISMYPLCRRISPDGHSKVWTPINFGVLLTDKTCVLRPITSDGYSLSQAVATADTIGELTTLCQFIAALACSNSTMIDEPPPSAKLNASRRQAKKTPFFSYKVLTIIAGGYAAKAGAKHGATHAAPRIHLRRGHIRRLETKNVWVNACVVGSKELGMVAKDYAIAKGEALAR